MMGIGKRNKRTLSIDFEVDITGIEEFEASLDRVKNKIQRMVNATDDTITSAAASIKLKDELVELIGRYDDLKEPELTELFKKDVRELKLNIEDEIKIVSEWRGMYYGSGMKQIVLKHEILSDNGDIVARVSTVKEKSIDTDTLYFDKLDKTTKEKLFIILLEFNKAKTKEKTL